MFRNNRLSKIDPHLATRLKGYHQCIEEIAKYQKRMFEYSCCNYRMTLIDQQNNVVWAVKAMIPALKDLEYSGIHGR